MQIPNATFTLSPVHDFGLALSTGVVKGAAGTNRSHSKPNIPSPGEFVVVPGADYGLRDYPFLPAGGGEITIESSTNDDTGRVVMVEGLDADGAARSAEVVLQGTTPVTSPGWWRINDAVTVGTEATVGTVTVRRAADAAVLFTYSASAQQGFPGVYTVPAGSTASIIGLIASMQKSTGSNTAAVIRIYTRPANTNIFYLAFATVAQRDGDPSPEFKNPTPDRVAPGTDVIFTVEGETSGQAVFIRASWVLLSTSIYPLGGVSI